MPQLTQWQQFQKSHRFIEDRNIAFMEIIDNTNGNGITSEELRKLIERRPELWGSFANWLGKLPADLAVATATDAVTATATATADADATKGEE